MSQSFYRWATLALLLIEIFIAVAVPADTYPFIRNSIGDLLVVILLYCLVKSFINAPALKVALSVLAFSFLVEAAQYFQFVEVFGIKNQILRVIIGTSFSVSDLVMYTIGIVIAYSLDTILMRIFPAYKKAR